MSASEVSGAVQDYLKAIWLAQERSAAAVSTKMLSGRLGVAPSSVSEMIRRLTRLGMVEHLRYGAITLTQNGRLVAVAMVRRHRLLEAFLVSVLGYSWEQVHPEAEQMEHAVSDAFIQRIDELLGHPARDPHGDPIPTIDGHVPAQLATLLSQVNTGEIVVIERVSDADPMVLHTAATLGLVPGSIWIVEGYGLSPEQIRIRRHFGDSHQAARNTAGHAAPVVPIEQVLAHSVWVLPNHRQAPQA